MNQVVRHQSHTLVHLINSNIKQSYNDDRMRIHNSSKKFNEHDKGNMQRNCLNSIEVAKNYNNPKYRASPVLSSGGIPPLFSLSPFSMRSKSH